MRSTRFGLAFFSSVRNDGAHGCVSRARCFTESSNSDGEILSCLPLKPLIVFLTSMKTFLGFVAFVALAGFAVWQHMTISSLNERVASLTPGKNPAPISRAMSRARPKPQPGELKKIICPLCHGEKTVAYIPPGRDLLHKELEVCPVCLGVGYRMLKVPPGYKACPDCKGMGIVYLPAVSGQRIRSDNCGRCGATGLVATLTK